jgi:glucose/arabinose dehydrogenase
VAPAKVVRGAKIAIKGRNFVRGKRRNVVVFLGGKGKVDDVKAKATTAKSSKAITLRAPTARIAKGGRGAVSGKLQVVNRKGKSRPSKTVVRFDDDGDGLTNEREIQLGTDPRKKDTDGDGLLDGQDPAPLTPGSGTGGGTTTPIDNTCTDRGPAIAGIGALSAFEGLVNVIQEGRSRIGHDAYSGTEFKSFCLLRKRRGDSDSTYQAVGSSPSAAAGVINDGQRPAKGEDYVFRTDVLTTTGHIPGANTIAARGAGSVADVEGWAQLEQSCTQCGSTSVQGGSLRSTVKGDGLGGADDTVGEIAVYKDRIALGTHPVDPNTIVTTRVLTPLSPSAPGSHVAAQLNLSTQHPAAVRDDASGTVADLLHSSGPWITVELQVGESGDVKVVAKDSAASAPDKVIAQSGDLLVDGPINNVYLTVQIVDPGDRYEVRYKPNTADPDVDRVLDLNPGGAGTDRALPGSMPTAWLSLDNEMSRFEPATHDVRFDEVEAVYQTSYELLEEKFGGLPSNVQVPAGFSATEVAHQLNGPTAIDFASNGDMYIAERDGKVKRLAAGAGPTGATEVLDITDLVNSGPNDQGLTGLTLDPNFVANGFLYVYYTVQKDDTFGDRTVSRVERFHVAGGVADRSDPLRKTLVGAANAAPSGDSCPPSTTSDCLPSDSYTHSSGDLQFGADGMLWISTPDGASPEGSGAGGTDPLALRSINPNSLAGKLLRVDPVTGNGVLGNPLYSPGSPGSPQSRTWAQGFRNPFRIAQRPSGPQSWYSTDVGWGAYEELNRIAGPSASPSTVANFAWPCFEGPFASPYNTQYTGAGQCPVSNRVDPLHYYSSDGVDHAIIGSAFYTGSAYPASWKPGANEAAFYFSDYPSGEITMIKTDANDQQLALQTFAGGFTGPVMVTEGPADSGAPGGDTALYVVNLGALDQATGRVWRITYAGP